MYFLHISVLAILSCSTTNAVSYTPLTSGAPYQSSVLPYYSFPNDTQGLAYDYYAIYVPTSVLSVQLNLQYNSTTCPLVMAVRILGFPCPNIAPFSSVSGICVLDSHFITSFPTTLTAAYPGAIEFLTGKNWYIGVGKANVAYNANSCPFTITATVSTCPGSQIDSAGNGNLQDCVALTTLNNTASFSVNTNVIFNGLQLLVPDYVGLVTISFTTQTSEIAIVASSWSTPVYSGDLSYSDVTQTNVTDAQGNFQNYRYSLTVNTPRAGPLNILLVNTYALSQNTPPPLTGTVSFAVLQCPSGSGGLSCTYVLAPFTPTSYSIPANSYLYLEFDYSSTENPAAFSHIDLQLASGGQVLIMLKREAFPIDVLYLGYDAPPYTVTVSSGTNTITNGFQLFPQDFPETSKYFVGFLGIKASTFTLNPLNSTSTTSTTGSGTSTVGVSNIAANLGAHSTGGPTLTLGFPGQGVNPTGGASVIVLSSILGLFAALVHLL